MGLVCKWRFSFHEFYNLFHLICYFFFFFVNSLLFLYFFYIAMTFTRGDFYFIKLIFTTLF